MQSLHNALAIRHVCLHMLLCMLAIPNNWAVFHKRLLMHLLTLLEFARGDMHYVVPFNRSASRP
jgi:hypothetical protein